MCVCVMLEGNSFFFSETVQLVLIIEEGAHTPTDPDTVSAGFLLFLTVAGKSDEALR